MKALSLFSFCLTLAACTGAPVVSINQDISLADPEPVASSSQPEPAGPPVSEFLPPEPDPASVASPSAVPAPAPPTPVFRPLLNNGIQDWIPEDSSPGSFTYAGDTLHVTGSRGWLRSPRQYADFILRVDFRFIEPGSDSGIFVRAGLGTNFIFGWPGDSYQVQVRDISENPTNPLPLGQVYRHVVPEGNTIYNGDMVTEVYSGVGEWQHYEVTVVGEMLTVRLNDRLVTTAENLDNGAGFIGFQSESGSIEYRNIEIYEF